MQSVIIFGSVGGALAMVVGGIVLIVIVTVVVLVTKRRKPKYQDANGKGTMSCIADDIVEIHVSRLGVTATTMFSYACGLFDFTFRIKMFKAVCMSS